MNKFDTPIIRYLNEQQIDFRLLPHDSPAISVQETARQRGISTDIMVKSILLRDMDNHFTLACIPGSQQVDPKKIRALLQCRRMTCVSATEVETISGYAPGTLTPLKIPKEMNLFFDVRLRQLDNVTISSGDLMAGIQLKLTDLVQLCQPRFADLCRTI